MGAPRPATPTLIAPRHIQSLPQPLERRLSGDGFTRATLRVKLGFLTCDAKAIPINLGFCGLFQVRENVITVKA